MSAEVKNKLFTPFFTTKDPGEGTGPGLSLSHSIIAEHGGKIEIESEPGNGAEFTILLPIKSLEEAAPVEIQTVNDKTTETNKPAFW
jgi:signal transduction histidine kinase